MDQRSEELNQAQPRRQRVFVIGLDGATFTLLKPWTAQGKLPHFQKLLEGGAHGLLRSTIPPLTPPAWTSSVTGVNPAKHGIYSFFKLMPTGRRVYTLRDVKAKTLWAILSAYGRESGILHLPLTYPVEPFTGFMVSGLMTPNTARDYTYPPQLREELESALPHYKLNVNTTSIRAGALEEFYQECRQLTQMQCQETRYLMQTREWDLFYVVFHVTDSLQHFFWKFMDPRHRFFPGPNKYQDSILRCYQEIDALLGEVLERLDDEAHVLILSDHGFERLDKNIYLTNWLIKEGYISLNQDAQLALKRLLFRVGIRRERLVQGLKKWHLGWFPKLFPERLKDQVPLSRPNFRHIEENIDWSRTRAYFLSAGGRAIYLNVKGREPQGIIEPGVEYEAVRRALIEQLAALRDPETGQLVFSAVCRREEIYPEDCAAGAPDIFLQTAPGYYLTEGMGGDRIFSDGGKQDSGRSGNHQMDGIVILYGNQIRAGVELQDASIVDIAPTILYLLGLPAQSDMDGLVLTSAIAPDHLDRYPITYDQIAVAGHDRERFEYTDEENTSIEQRLRDMGYL
ncbi:MAG: alkaline phosphatase family protein [Acidobacteria bacterium]|nr:alkaline phosphatase family protein [Acidobacteriota bacterium]